MSPFFGEHDQTPKQIIVQLMCIQDGQSLATLSRSISLTWKKKELTDFSQIKVTEKTELLLFG